MTVFFFTLAALLLVRLSSADDCRLCVSCAQMGDYSVEVGHQLHQGDWGPYNTYPEGCVGDNVVLRWDEVKLCCSPPTPTCSLCQSCGGEYPFEMGRRLNVGDWGQWITREEECGGAYVPSLNEWSLCCRSRNSCRICQECGSGLKEVGRVVHQGDYGAYTTFTREACAVGVDDYQVSDYNSNGWTGVEPKICCPA